MKAVTSLPTEVNATMIQGNCWIFSVTPLSQSRPTIFLKTSPPCFSSFPQWWQQQPLRVQTLQLLQVIDCTSSSTSFLPFATSKLSLCFLVVIVLILLTVAALGVLLYRYLCHNKGDYRTTGELAPGEDPEEDNSNRDVSEKKEYFIWAWWKTCREWEGLKRKATVCFSFVCFEGKAAATCCTRVRGLKKYCKIPETQKPKIKWERWVN